MDDVGPLRPSPVGVFLMRIIREPSQMLDVTVKPVIFILLFVADATPRAGDDPLVDRADPGFRPLAVHFYRRKASQ